MCVFDDRLGNLGAGVHTVVRLASVNREQWVTVKCFPVTGGNRSKLSLQKK